MTEPPPPNVLDYLISSSLPFLDPKSPQAGARLYRALCDALVEYTTGKLSGSQPNGSVEPYMWSYLRTVLDSQDDNLLPETQEAVRGALAPHGNNGQTHYGLHMLVEARSNNPEVIPPVRSRKDANSILTQIPLRLRSEAEKLGALVQKYLQSYQERI